LNCYIYNIPYISQNKTTKNLILIKIITSNRPVLSQSSNSIEDFEAFFFYLGYGDPFMGFCPYFLHAHMSEERLSTGT
jgi:hypothetical protein